MVKLNNLMLPSTELPIEALGAAASEVSKQAARCSQSRPRFLHSSAAFYRTPCVVLASIALDGAVSSYFLGGPIFSFRVDLL